MWNTGSAWAATMPPIDMVPAWMTTPTTARIRGSSYAMSWAAARSPPMSEYLFAEDHPAMSTPMAAMELTARA
jgi:hypothetical protein